MCDISLEPCSLWSEVSSKARKDHTCSSCRGRINRGDTYIRHFSKFEGDIASEKLCMPCQIARARFTEAHGDLTPTPSGFASMLEDCVVDGINDEWSSMLSAMRQRRDDARVVSQLFVLGKGTG
jgi:hypothetical protein